MEQAPKDPKEPILGRQDWHATIGYGLSISAAVLGVVAYANFALHLDHTIINNMAFYTLVLAQLFNVFNLPKSEESFFLNEVTKNSWVWGALVLSLAMTVSAYLVPPIAKALSLQALNFEQVATVIGFALGSLVLAQLLKRLKRAF